MMVDGKAFPINQFKKEKVYTLKKTSIENASKYNEKDLSKYFAKEEKVRKVEILKRFSKRIERQSKSGHKYIYIRTSSFPENK